MTKVVVRSCRSSFWFWHSSLFQSPRTDWKSVLRFLALAGHS